MPKMVLSCIGILLAAICCLEVAGQEPTNSVPPSPSAPAALLNRYCVTCHNDKLHTADLKLDRMDIENAGKDPEVWEKVVRKLRTGAMPPAGVPRPDAADYDSLASYLESQLDRAAVEKPNPGRPGIHRLNRAEYKNAIR